MDLISDCEETVSRFTGSSAPLCDSNLRLLSLSNIVIFWAKHQSRDHKKITYSVTLRHWLAIDWGCDHRSQKERKISKHGTEKITNRLQSAIPRSLRLRTRHCYFPIRIWAYSGEWLVRQKIIALAVQAGSSERSQCLTNALIELWYSSTFGIFAFCILWGEYGKLSFFNCSSKCL